MEFADLRVEGLHRHLQPALLVVPVPAKNVVTLRLLVHDLLPHSLVLLLRSEPGNAASRALGVVVPVPVELVHSLVQRHKRLVHSRVAQVLPCGHVGRLQRLLRLQAHRFEELVLKSTLLFYFRTLGAMD